MLFGRGFSTVKTYLVPLRSLSVFLITLLQYLVLTYAFFSCWGKHPLVTLLWLTVSPLPLLPAALGIVLTSGCATSRHCQQQELPGVRIHCCDSDLCNSAPFWSPYTFHYICALASLLLLRMWLWCGVHLESNRAPLHFTCRPWENHFVLKSLSSSLHFSF